MEIVNISPDAYKSFINDKFETGSKTISGEAMIRINEITGMHTFYIQYLCNRLYGAFDKVDVENVNMILLEILNENEAVYANYLKLLTSGM
jgi:hypothetical protein